MRNFYDTEFVEDGETIDLISIGIVADDGREFYAVSNEFDTRRVFKHDWLMKNVMSSIGHEVVDGDIVITDPAAMSRAEIRDGITSFLTGKLGQPELWAWYGAYDHVALAQLFGTMIQLPTGIPMYTNDIMTLVDLAGGVRIPAQVGDNHNALADARFNKVRYDYLMELR